MTIREFDDRLYRQLAMCLTGEYAGAGGDAVTPEMLSGLQRSLEEASVGRRCDCGDPSCRSFGIAGTQASASSRRVRFRVHGELALVCDSLGRLQHVEWLPELPDQRRKRYENRTGEWIEVSLCPFPE